MCDTGSLPVVPCHVDRTQLHARELPVRCPSRVTGPSGSLADRSGRTGMLATVVVIAELAASRGVTAADARGGEGPRKQSPRSRS